MAMWGCSCSRSGCPALAEEIRVHKHQAVLYCISSRYVPCWAAGLQLHRTARLGQSCRAVQHTGATNSLMPIPLLQSNGHPKTVRLRLCTQLCWAHRTHCAQWKGTVKCSAPAALKESYNLLWKKSCHDCQVIRASLIQNTWSFSQQALKTGTAQSFRQELQKQIPFPFPLMSLWSKGEFYLTQPKS